MMKKIKKCKTKKCKLTLDEQVSITKKISRETFLHINTLTRSTKDKTLYNRKIKHKKPKDSA